MNLCCCDLTSLIHEPNGSPSPKTQRHSTPFQSLLAFTLWDKAGPHMRRILTASGTQLFSLCTQTSVCFVLSVHIGIFFGACSHPAPRAAGGERPALPSKKGNSDTASSAAPRQHQVVLRIGSRGWKFKTKLLVLSKAENQPVYTVEAAEENTHGHVHQHFRPWNLHQSAAVKTPGVVLPRVGGVRIK